MAIAYLQITYRQQVAGTTRQKLHLVELETQINQLQSCSNGALTSS